MNLDIVDIVPLQDLGLAATAVPRAGNLLSVQQASLEYAFDFGIDLRFFLESPFQFQNESFKAYLVERLTTYRINVSEVRQTLETLFSNFTLFVDDAQSNVTSLIR